MNSSNFATKKKGFISSFECRRRFLPLRKSMAPFNKGEEDLYLFCLLQKRKHIFRFYIPVLRPFTFTFTPACGSEMLFIGCCNFVNPFVT